MLTYLKIIFTGALLLGLFGIAVPTLVSMSDTVAVIGGFLVLFSTPLLVYQLWSKEIGQAYEYLTKEASKSDEEDVV
jgi:hypothetical protein